VLRLRPGRGQRDQRVGDDLVDLCLHVTGADQVAVAVERTLTGEVGHPARFHDGDVVVARGVVQLDRVDAGDLGGHIGSFS
jgi:hypothetical protein